MGVSIVKDHTLNADCMIGASHSYLNAVTLTHTLSTRKSETSTRPRCQTPRSHSHSHSKQHSSSMGFTHLRPLIQLKPLMVPPMVYHTGAKAHRP